MSYDKIVTVLMAVPIIIPLILIYVLAPYFLPPEVTGTSQFVLWNVIVVILYMAGTGILMMVGYFFIPLITRANTISFLGRKNLGIVEIAGKGKSVTRSIVDFDQEVAVIGNGVFYLNPTKVYHKEGCPTLHFNEVDALEPVDYNAGKLTEAEFKEVPKCVQRLLKNKQHDFKIYLYPVSFEKDKPTDKYRNPELISSIFMKQKSLAEAQAMWNETNFKMLLIVSLVLGAAAAILAYQNYDALTNQVVPLLEKLAGAIK